MFKVNSEPTHYRRFKILRAHLIMEKTQDVIDKIACQVIAVIKKKPGNQPNKYYELKPKAETWSNFNP